MSTSTSLHPQSSTSLSLPPNTYIYDIKPLSPTSTSIASISSDNTISIFDKTTLSLLSTPGAGAARHEGVTALAIADAVGNVVATAGRDAQVRLWDVRGGNVGSVGKMGKAGDNAAILSLGSCPARNCIVTGTELTSHQAVVTLWDTRSTSKPILEYIESHNDDVTALHFHPSNPTLLLSGSTDSLINIYNTSISDEDECLVQVLNHGASIHKAGFLTDTDVLGLSHDETFAVYGVSEVEETEKDEITQFGDLRGVLGIEYIIDVVRGAVSGGAYVVGGRTSNPGVDIVPLIQNTTGTGPKWALNQSQIYTLPNAHNDEIVRALYLDEASNKIFTAGEDGHVRVWGLPDGGAPSAGLESTGSIKTSSAKKSAEKAKGKKDGRFAPY